MDLASCQGGMQGGWNSRSKEEAALVECAAQGHKSLTVCDFGGCVRVGVRDMGSGRGSKVFG